MRGWIRQVVWENRKGIRKKLIQTLRASIPELSTEADDTGVDTIVLSYENILGTYNLAQTPKLYQELKRGLNLLNDAFGIENMAFFFSYRSMDRFIESCYLQCIHTQKETRHFDEFLSDIRLKKLSWLDVIRRISKQTGKERLWVWPYEPFSENETAVWQALLGRENPENLLPRNTNNLNPSLTKEAVECLRVANGLFARRAARNLSRFLKENVSVEKSVQV